jgi:hypothetical protein
MLRAKTVLILAILFVSPAMAQNPGLSIRPGMLQPQNAEPLGSLKTTVLGQGSVWWETGGCNVMAGNSSNTCLAKVPANQSLKITAKPAPNAVFVRWEGACSGTALTCVVRATDGTDVTARFERPKIRLTIQYQILPVLALKLTTAPLANVSCTELPLSGVLKKFQCYVDVAKGEKFTLSAMRTTGVGGSMISQASGASWGGACAGTTGTQCVISPTDPTTITISHN